MKRASKLKTFFLCDVRIELILIVFYCFEDLSFIYKIGK